MAGGPQARLLALWLWTHSLLVRSPGGCLPCFHYTIFGVLEEVCSVTPQHSGSCSAWQPEVPALGGIEPAV